MYFIKNVQISKGTASAKNDTHLPHHSLTLKKWFYLLNKHETFVFIFLRCKFCFFLSALKQNRESGIDFCRANTGFQNESCVRIQHVRSPPPDNGKWAGDLECLIFRKLKLLQTKFVMKKRGPTPILMWRGWGWLQGEFHSDFRCSPNSNTVVLLSRTHSGLSLGRKSMNGTRHQVFTHLHNYWPCDSSNYSPPGWPNGPENCYRLFF